VGSGVGVAKKLLKPLLFPVPLVPQDERKAKTKITFIQRKTFILFLF
jgi:hypothetical protein